MMCILHTLSHLCIIVSILSFFSANNVLLALPTISSFALIISMPLIFQLFVLPGSELLKRPETWGHIFKVLGEPRICESEPNDTVGCGYFCLFFVHVGPDSICCCVPSTDRGQDLEVETWDKSYVCAHVHKHFGAALVDFL